MIVKGLPDSYNSFTTVISQMEEQILDFAKFKTHIRSYEENQNARKDHEDSSDIVSKIDGSSTRPFTCFICKEPGHKAYQCPKYEKKTKRNGRWCTYCKTGTHDTKYCNKKKIQSSAKCLRTNEPTSDGDTLKDGSVRIRQFTDPHIKGENTKIRIRKFADPHITLATP